ncbi:Copper chaperone CopZ [Caloramator fervidus]|uniref:Copper chaperone CopZ n=1 Tax=Caloramator fervidus TaxID=29344 RepID=A0A1H5RM29_9CLOT|nr:heavy-metal-associated domain-containing protein [Caloramator fervidus]SEF38551.1 Copper chaperone CopZ [Caloramator fervidus]
MKKKLYIEGMSCNHCKNHVKNALEEGGVKVLEVNLEKKYALVEGENLDYERLKSLVEEAGYDVVAVENI